MSFDREQFRESLKGEPTRETAEDLSNMSRDSFLRENNLPHPPVLFAGSREKNLRGQYFYNIIYDEVGKLPKGTIIVSGMATGTDIYAYRAAKAQHYPVVEFPITDAEWKYAGKKMGRIRNRVMAFYLECIGGVAKLFINNGNWTPGTSNMKLYLENMDIEHVVHDLSLTPEELNTPVKDWKKV